MLHYVTPSNEPRRRATYEDVLQAPEHLVAEVIDGELFLSPRPAPRHADATAVLIGRLSGPFRFGEGGPGGWRILVEPELRFGDDVLVPDLAGWRLARMPGLPDTAYFTVTPDWVCEVLSPSTAKLDRRKKLGVYAREGVQHTWLVDPIARTLEVLALNASQWTLHANHTAGDRIRAVPFDAIEIDLVDLWGENPPQPKARSGTPKAGPVHS